MQRKDSDLRVDLVDLRERAGLDHGPATIMCLALAVERGAERLALAIERAAGQLAPADDDGDGEESPAYPDRVKATPVSSVPLVPVDKSAIAWECATCGWSVEGRERPGACPRCQQKRFRGWDADGGEHG